MLIRKFILILVFSLLVVNILVSEETTPQSGTISQGGFSMGFGVNSVTFNGETWTRVNLFPIIPVWKFKFAFDVEFFIDAQGNFSKKGWDFSSLDAGLDTVLRKIYYISFNEKKNVTSGDEFLYFKIGAIDNATIGLGFIMNNYANTLNYPMEKQLGAEFAIGNLTPVKMGLELVINNFANITRGGLVLGSRFFIHPLAFTGIPIIDKIQIGISYCADFNQYSGLKDTDNDTYPDEIDKFPLDPRYYADTDNDGTPDDIDLDIDGDNIPDYNNLHITNKQALTNFLISTLNLPESDVINMVDFDVRRASYFSLLNKYDYFSIIGADIIIPIINLPNVFELKLYSQFGMNLDINQDNDTNMLDGWGMAAPGVSITLFNDIFACNLEFRKRVGNFVANYFNREYDRERTIIINQIPITKDNYIQSTSANGVYGSVTANLFVIYAFGSLEYLVPELTNVNFTSMDATFEAKAYLNTNLVQQIPVVKDYIDNLEAYFTHKNITHFTNFFTPNPNMSMGATVSIKLGGTTKLKYSFQRNFVYDINLNIVPDDIMQIGTETTF